jgi:hypothetical protein
MNLAGKVRPNSVVFECPIVIGEKKSFALVKSLDDVFRGRIVRTNVPCPAFFVVTKMLFGNIDSLYGAAGTDGWALRDYELDVPTITPNQNVTFEGEYLGLIPEGAKAGETLLLKFEIEELSISAEDT